VTTSTQLWERYSEYTRDFTEHARKLGFAGPAVCWLFKTEDFTFPVAIYAALLSFVAYFTADILQCLFGAAFYRLFVRRSEYKCYTEHKTISFKIEGVPAWLDAPATFFFLIKAMALCVGFGWICVELVTRIF
jgi:hypothetical protein